MALRWLRTCKYSSIMRLPRLTFRELITACTPTNLTSRRLSSFTLTESDSLTTNKFTVFNPAQVRINLYPEDEDDFLKEMHGSKSFEQIFDLLETIPPDKRTTRHSAQALISLWDLQKLMFTYGYFYNISRDINQAEGLLKSLRDHKVFKECLSHILSHSEEMDDVSLSAVLVVLKNFGYSIRGSECQRLISSLLQRKDTLSLHAISRLAVSMRNESVYGAMVMLEILPSVLTYILTMETDAEVNMMSITLRRGYQCFPDSSVFAFRDRLEHLWNASNGNVDYKADTYCKILMALFRSSQVDRLGQENKTHKLTRLFGRKLIPLLDDTNVMDVTSLANFANREMEPADLRDALNDRMSHLMETCPSLHLISCVYPKNTKQRIRLSEFIKKEMAENPSDFSYCSNLYYRTLMKSIIDTEVCDMFWNMLGSRVISSISDSAVGRYDYLATLMEGEGKLEDEFGSDGVDNEDLSNEETSVSSAWQLQHQSHILARWAHAYIRFLYACRGTYVNEKFENVMTQEVVAILQRYEHENFLLYKADYCNMISFLIATSYEDWRRFIRLSFFRNFRPPELNTVQKAIDISGKMAKQRWRSELSELLDLLNKQAEVLLELPEGNLSQHHYIQLAQLNVEYHRAFTPSPVFLKCIHALEVSNQIHMKNVKEQLFLSLISGYYSPSLMEKASQYIISHGADDTSYLLAERFLLASYVCGVDLMDGHRIAAERIERDYQHAPPMQTLSSMISMCFLGCLSPELVKKVFSVEYIDGLDEHIRKNKVGGNSSAKLHEKLMQLNRAVCIDMPETRVPWFHEKYCQDLSELRYVRSTYTHNEIRGLLQDLCGPDAKVLEHTHSPYYYLLDFVIQPKEEQNGSSHNQRKIAILLRNMRDYTSNERRLKGGVQMEKRHLEILGYSVVDIDPITWNSMHMSEKSAKRNFLLAALNS